MTVHHEQHSLTVDTESPAETARLGEALGRVLAPDDVVLLFGDLGAGKTTLVQGLAASLGVLQPVTSPTFTLIHEYQGAGTAVVHLDPYRLEAPEDIEGLGFFDYLGRGAIVVVEWADRLGDLAPEQAVRLKIEQRGLETRRITVLWPDRRLSELASELEKLQ